MSAAAASLILPATVPAPQPTKRRGNRNYTPVRPIVRRAVAAMIRDGLSADQAAAKVGLKPEAFYRSLAVPQVKQLLVDELDVLAESKRPRAIHRIDQLGESAASEAVKLNANKFLATKGNSDRGPMVAIQINNQQPGYMIAVDPRYAADVGTQPQPARLTTDVPKPLK